MLLASSRIEANEALSRNGSVFSVSACESSLIRVIYVSPLSKMQLSLLSALSIIALIARLVISSSVSLPLGRSSSVLFSVPVLVASLGVLRSTGSNSGLVELKRGGGGLLGLRGDGVAL